MKIDELNAIKDKMKNQVTLRAEDPDSTKVLVAMGTCGIGNCQLEPIVEIFEKGKDKVTYVNMNADKAKEVIEKHLIGGQVVSEYTI